MNKHAKWIVKTDRSLATNLARLEKLDEAKCISRALRQSGTCSLPSSSHRSESSAIASSLSGRRVVVGSGGVIASDAEEDSEGGATTRSSLLFVRLLSPPPSRSSSTTLFFPVLDLGAKKDVIMTFFLSFHIIMVHTERQIVDKK